MNVSVKSSVFLVLLLALPSAAEAGKVVVDKLGGRGTRYVQTALEDVVRRDNTLASAGAFRRTARKKKVSLRNDAGYAKVAKAMGVDVLIAGNLKRVSRKEYRLTLAVREGRSGKAETVTVALASPRPNAADKEKIATALLPVVAKAPPVSEPAAPEPVVEVQPDASKPPPAVASQETDDTETAPLKATLPSQISEAKTEGSLSTGPGDELVTARRYRYPGADVAVGVGFLRRDLDFTSVDSLTPAQRPNGYKGGTPVVGLSVFGELYPLSFGDSGGILSGLGIGFAFDRVFNLNSKLGTDEFDTTQTDYSIGLRYRYNFGSSPNLPSVKLLAGWNHLDFKIDRGGVDIDLPNVSYSYIDLGLGLRVPLSVPWLALFAEGRYLLVLSSGEISEQAFYGDGSENGFDVGGGVEVRIAQAWSIRGGARYRRIKLDFDGNGEKSNNRDGNPTTQDVGGAEDKYLTFSLLIGYVF